MNNRLYIIDFIRGCAIVMMVIFHIFLSFNLFNNTNYNLSTGILNLFGIISRNIFIFLSGISLYLSYKNNKKQFINKQINRLISIFIFSIIVTILSYIVLPDKYIIFGILHYMFLSLLILVLYLKFFNTKYLYSFLGISLIFKNIELSPNIIFDNNYFNNYFSHILGFNPYYKNAIDYFPLKNWLYKSILGIIFASYINIEKKNINYFKNSVITKLGKNSLFIYIFHLPIMYFINKL
jgi:uncharacterized membrane protein